MTLPVRTGLMLAAFGLVLVSDAPRSAAQVAGAGLPPGRAERLTVRTVSTRADRVSDGNVLVEIAMPSTGMSVLPLARLNGRDVSAVFRRGGSSNAVLGLLTGLAPGRNTLVVDGTPFRLPAETVTITNYPRTGPITSGPHIVPFVCQTQEFALPDGSMLGAALDANCSVDTKVQYVYMPKGSGVKTFKPLPPGATLPRDVANTTTSAGVSVPFVVRVETGTMNRGIYQNVVLHDPTREEAPTPFSPPRGWNRRLIALHGVGCPGGWYRQGAVQGVNPLAGANVARLGEGYGIFINTLNHPTNSCNAVLAGETTMMGKEHFIETFGEPFATISTGTSGGAYTSLQLADAFPGLFDGVLIMSTFPDALSIALAGLDARLLMRYFQTEGAAGLSDAQKVAVSGYAGFKALADAANQAQRTDPVRTRVDLPGYSPAVWNAAVPEPDRYDPSANPKGARPTIFDVARNVYGIDRATGAALRPFDNVGVQYGLAALKAKAITLSEFLDVNERIGGYDNDANPIEARSVGDPGAIRRAYQAGVTLSGGGGLASIPVFDAGNYNEAAAYHYQWFHFAVRERMKQASGTAANHLMWRGRVPPERSWAVIEEWVTAVKNDKAAGKPVEKVQRNRPDAAQDGCWPEAATEAPAEFVREAQTFGRDPDSACNKRLPSFGFTRLVAGGPLHANTLKCQLKPIDAKDYGVELSAADLRRLRSVFPAGVCDWSKPGAGATRVVPWASFGPAPENLVFDVSRPTAPRTTRP